MIVASDNIINRNYYFRNVATLRTQQGGLPKDEGTPPQYQGPILPEAHPKPQEDQTRHQDLATMATFLFPLQKIEQIPQV